MNVLAKWAIRAYQLFLRPFVGNCCRFHPTCSEYALEAFEKKSFFKASFLTLQRLLKCHPYHPGGSDPVP
jgi:putative membrane protein insertion efficiency factor